MQDELDAQTEGNDDDTPLTPEAEQAEFAAYQAENGQPQSQQGEADEGDEGDQAGYAGPGSKAAYHREKETRQRIQLENAELKGRLQVLQEISTQAQQQAQPKQEAQDTDPEPDAEEDPVGHVEWRLRQAEKAANEREQRFQQELALRDQRQRERDILASEQLHIAQDGGREVWSARVEFFKAKAQVAPGLLAQVAQADDPAAELKMLTDTFGFDPASISSATETASVSNQRQSGNPKPAAPQQKRVQSLSGVSGGRAPSDEVDFDNLSDDDYDAMPEEKRRRLLSTM